MPPVRHVTPNDTSHLSTSSSAVVGTDGFVQNDVTITFTTATTQRRATATVFTSTPLTSDKLDEFSSDALRYISGQSATRRLESSHENADLQLLSLAFEKFITKERSGALTRANVPYIVPHFHGTMEQALQPEIEELTDTLSVTLWDAIFPWRRELHRAIWCQIYDSQPDIEKDRLELKWDALGIRDFNMSKVRGYMKITIADRLLANGSVFIGGAGEAAAAAKPIIKDEIEEAGFVMDAQTATHVQSRIVEELEVKGEAGEELVVKTENDNVALIGPRRKGLSMYLLRSLGL